MARTTFETLLTTDEHGKPYLHNRRLFDLFLKENTNQQFSLKIKRQGKKVSNPANRYYWGVCVVLFQRGMRGLGYDYDANATHEFMKSISNVMFDEIDINGTPSRMYKSLTQLTNDEFSQYIEDVKRFAAQNLHVAIPDANENDNNHG